MRFTKVVLFLSLVLVLLPTILLAQPPANVAAKRWQANADLDNLAQQIAILCAQPGFRGVLRSEIAKSKNREQILKLDRFLDRASRQKGMPPGLAKAKDTTLKARGRLKTSAIWNFEVAAHQGYDLYIPVEAHRKKWGGGKDFLVAFSPVDDEKYIRQIVAYQVRDGKRVFLDPNMAPDKVVLVIAPCEHPSHEPAGPGIVVPKAPDMEPEKLKGGPAPAPGAKNTYIGVPYVKITRDLEGWGMGKPEVYAIVLQKYKTSPRDKKVWLNSGSIDVNKVNYWYSIGDCRTCPLYVYFDSNYSDVTYYAFWEHDGGFTIPLTPTLCFPYLGCFPQLGVTIGYGDDFFGEKYINKNNISYSGYHLQSNRYVYFKVDKDP